tara:strand:+ start:2674 stop:2841 length:168 start_codon:yes stop_codon:yes gene_type:complete
MNIENIKQLPTTYEGENRIHESIFKSYHILEFVMKLIERGADKETIKEIVEYLKQ